MKPTDWLADDERLKGAEIFVTLLTIFSGIIWIYLDGFTGEVIAQVTATLGTGLIVLVTVLRKLRGQQFDNFVSAGSMALQKLQLEHMNILSGPRCAREKKRQNKDSDQEQDIESKDDERKDDGPKYLFYQKDPNGEEANFISVIPFEKAIVEVYCGHRALKIVWDIKKPAQEDIDEVGEKIKQTIIKLAETKYKGLYDIVSYEPPRKPSRPNLCVALDFIDEKISPKKFEKIVYDIGKAALETIKSHRKKS